MADEIIPQPTVVSFHGDTFPADCCEHCSSRVEEAVALRARAGLLRKAIADSDPRVVVEWHAIELLAMLAARGMA